MKFSLDEMRNIKSGEIDEMKSIVGKNKVRNRPVYKIRDTLVDKINIITELKHASPSAGQLTDDSDDAKIVKSYIKGGASAVSVLTEKNFFSGSYDHLQSVSALCNMPVLCKDFIYFEEQVEAAYLCGADMVLLISKVLDKELIKKLYDEVTALGMTPLVEIHEKKEIENIMFLNPEFVLVNMRNLTTLEMNPNTGIETLKNLPAQVTSISASGINTKEDILYIMDETGTKNFLIGSSLMTSRNPEKMIRDFKNVY